MELVEHSKYIWEYKNVVPLDVCEEVVNQSKKMFSLVGDSELFPRNHIRNNTGIAMSEHAHKHAVIYELDQIAHHYISFIHKKYLLNNKLIRLAGVNTFNCDLQLNSIYTYRKYDKNDEYKWHVDINPGSNFVLSYIIYLNDEYEGGYTMFLNERIKVKGSPGSILCFPCGFNMLHKSSKIKSGEKHIIWTCMNMIGLQTSTN